MAISRFPDETSSRPLAKPLQFHFSKKVAKNRLMKAAMTESLATWDLKTVEERGIPTQALIELYRRWGEHANNWGIITTGNVIVNLDTPAGGGDSMISIDSKLEGRRFEAFKSLAAAGKANGSLMIAQISHPGRQMQSKFGKEVVAPSAIQLEPKMGMTFATPRAATESDIADIVESFAHAAAYLEAAGFDGIELHGAHGYLLAQFLARSSNTRTDRYGGSLANRARLLVEVTAAIRARTSPDFIVSAKLNSVEFQEGGFTPEEASELVTILQDEVQLDFIELSGGTYEKFQLEFDSGASESTRRREAFFLEFAERIVPALGTDRRTKVFITGGLRSVGAMVHALDVVDGVGLGRPAAAEPRLAADIIEGRVASAIKPLPPFDIQNTGMGLAAAAAHIRQIAHGQEPVDLSDAATVASLQQDMMNWFGRVAGDDKVELVGSFDLTGPTRAYGLAY